MTSCEDTLLSYKRALTFTIIHEGAHRPRETAENTRRRSFPGRITALGVRTTGHANLTRGHHQECTTLERVSVFLEYGIELVDLGV
jgi:hypothetical protein